MSLVDDTVDSVCDRILGRGVNVPSSVRADLYSSSPPRPPQHGLVEGSEAFKSPQELLVESTAILNRLREVDSEIIHKKNNSDRNSIGNTRRGIEDTSRSRAYTHTRADCELGASMMDFIEMETAANTEEVTEVLDGLRRVKPFLTNSFDDSKAKGSVTPNNNNNNNNRNCAYGRAGGRSSEGSKPLRAVLRDSPMISASSLASNFTLDEVRNILMYSSNNPHVESMMKRVGEERERELATARVRSATQINSELSSYVESTSTVKTRKTTSPATEANELQGKVAAKEETAHLTAHHVAALTAGRGLPVTVISEPLRSELTELKRQQNVLLRMQREALDKMGQTSSLPSPPASFVSYEEHLKACLEVMKKDKVSSHAAQQRMAAIATAIAEANNSLRVERQRMEEERRIWRRERTAIAHEAAELKRLRGREGGSKDTMMMGEQELLTASHASARIVQMLLGKEKATTGNLVAAAASSKGGKGGGAATAAGDGDDIVLERTAPSIYSTSSMTALRRPPLAPHSSTPTPTSASEVTTNQIDAIAESTTTADHNDALSVLTPAATATAPAAVKRKMMLPRARPSPSAAIKGGSRQPMSLTPPAPMRFPDDVASSASGNHHKSPAMGASEQSGQVSEAQDQGLGGAWIRLGSVAKPEGSTNGVAHNNNDNPTSGSVSNHVVIMSTPATKDVGLSPRRNSTVSIGVGNSPFASKSSSSSLAGAHTAQLSPSASAAGGLWEGNIVSALGQDILGARESVVGRKPLAPPPITLIATSAAEDSMIHRSLYRGEASGLLALEQMSKKEKAQHVAARGRPHGERLFDTTIPLTPAEEAALISARLRPRRSSREGQQGNDTCTDHYGNEKERDPPESTAIFGVGTGLSEFEQILREARARKRRIRDLYGILTPDDEDTADPIVRTAVQRLVHDLIAAEVKNGLITAEPSITKDEVESCLLELFNLPTTSSAADKSGKHTEMKTAENKSVENERESNTTTDCPKNDTEEHNSGRSAAFCSTPSADEAEVVMAMLKEIVGTLCNTQTQPKEEEEAQPLPTTAATVDDEPLMSTDELIKNSIIAAAAKQDGIVKAKHKHEIIRAPLRDRQRDLFDGTSSEEGDDSQRVEEGKSGERGELLLCPSHPVAVKGKVSTMLGQRGSARGGGGKEENEDLRGLGVVTVRVVLDPIVVQHQHPQPTPSLALPLPLPSISLVAAEGPLQGERRGDIGEPSGEEGLKENKASAILHRVFADDRDEDDVDVVKSRNEDDVNKTPSVRRSSEAEGGSGEHMAITVVEELPLSLLPLEESRMLNRHNAAKEIIPIIATEELARFAVEAEAEEIAMSSSSSSSSHDSRSSSSTSEGNSRSSRELEKGQKSRRRATSKKEEDESKRRSRRRSDSVPTRRRVTSPRSSDSNGHRRNGVQRRKDDDNDNDGTRRRRLRRDDSSDGRRGRRVRRSEREGSRSSSTSSSSSRGKRNKRRQQQQRVRFSHSLTRAALEALLSLEEEETETRQLVESIEYRELGGLFEQYVPRHTKKDSTAHPLSSPLPLLQTSSSVIQQQTYVSQQMPAAYSGGNAGGGHYPLPMVPQVHAAYPFNEVVHRKGATTGTIPPNTANANTEGPAQDHYTKGVDHHRQQESTNQPKHLHDANAPCEGATSKNEPLIASWVDGVARSQAEGPTNATPGKQTKTLFRSSSSAASSPTSFNMSSTNASSYDPRSGAHAFYVSNALFNRQIGGPKGGAHAKFRVESNVAGDTTTTTATTDTSSHGSSLHVPHGSSLHVLPPQNTVVRQSIYALGATKSRSRHKADSNTHNADIGVNTTSTSTATRTTATTLDSSEILRYQQHKSSLLIYSNNDDDKN